KAAVLLPVLAAADALILAVPAIAGRLQSGFALAYLAVLFASVVGLAAALAVPLVSARRRPAGLGRRRWQVLKESCSFARTFRVPSIQFHQKNRAPRTGSFTI